MMRDEEFIQGLTLNLEPKSSYASSQKALLLWMIVTFAVLILGILLVSVRSDVTSMLEARSFYFELFSALSLGIIAAGSALHLRIPGSKAPRKVLAFAIGMWLLSLIYHASVVKVNIPFTFKTAFNCMTAIVGLSALPGLVLFLLVRRGATTEPQLTFAIIGIAMGAAAAAFLPLSCANDTALHLVIGHGAPLLLFSVLFWFIGPGLLRW